jgi:hypothetical protein
MRDKPSIGGVTAFSLAAALVALSFFQMHFVESSGDGDLLWNGNEAYLFVHGVRRSYRLSYLGYLGEMIKEPLGVVASPDSRSPFTLVVQITPSAVRSYQVAGEFEFCTPLEHSLRLSRDDSTDVKGWSARHSVTSRTYEEFKIQVRWETIYACGENTQPSE